MKFNIEVKVYDYDTEKEYVKKGTAEGHFDSDAFNKWVAHNTPASSDVVEVIKFEEIKWI